MEFTPKLGKFVIVAFQNYCRQMMSQGRQGITGLAKRLEMVRRRIAAAARRSHRSTDEITLLAVSKTHPAETLRQALALGVADLGENRVQEAEGKIDELGHGAARWHLIGHLQANKARRAVKLFDVIHSVDSRALAERLDRHCAEEAREPLPVLLQVDLGEEATKTGVDIKELNGLAQTVRDCPNLKLTGLMTLPPFFSEAEEVRPYFKKLAQLRDSLQAQGFFGDQKGQLSMGMSHDFEIAIEEGATIVRIGTAVFGEREP